MTTIYDAEILLVDDNPDLLTLITDNLHTAGYKTVRTAKSCAAARAAFAAHRPALMILDINLPDGDGFGLFRALSNVYAGFEFLKNLNIPSPVYNMMPYIISLVVLAFTSKKSRAPKAEGIPYDKGQR